MYKLFLVLILLNFVTKIFGQNTSNVNNSNEFLNENNQEKPHRKKIRNSESPTPGKSKVRKFEEVLEEVITEFGFDVKAGQIKGLKNLAIRRAQVSDTLPRSYENYIEMLVTEKIRENSKTKLINCIQCKVKSSTIVENKIVINSPSTSVARMDQAANELGIENFMDIMLMYQSTQIIMTVNVFDSTSKEMLWAKTYNSETLRTRYQKLAIDYQQIEKSRNSDVYEPDYRLLIGIGYGSLVNVNATSEDQKMLVATLRIGEKFNNRKDEFGICANFWNSTRSLLQQYPSAGTNTNQTASANVLGPQPFKQAFSLFPYYAHNFLGAVENYDQIRQGINFGVGALFATGYFSPSARLGWDLYFGRRFLLTPSLIYNTDTKILINNELKNADGGLGYDLSLAINF